MNKKLKVYRAHFSAVTKYEVEKAMNTLTNPDEFVFSLKYA